MRRAAALLILLALAGPAAAQEEAPVIAQWGRPLAPVEVALDRGYLRSEFLWWYLKQLHTPPLVTTGPSGGTGALDDPNTTVLRGGDLPSRHGRYIGVRNSGEYWLGVEERFGVQASATILERDSTNVTYDWGTIPLLARPYTDAVTGRQKAVVVAGHDPALGDLAGSVNVYSRIEFFSEDVAGTLRLLGGEHYRLNALVGARFIQMRERLDITACSRIQPALAVLFSATDHFQTYDKFYGGEFGLFGDLRYGRFLLEAKGVLAPGADDQQIRAKGDRVFNTPAVRTTANYGLYVLPSNTGDFDRGRFDFVTEWSVNLVFRWTNHVRSRVGYTLTTWNNPVRPGDQITVINLSQVSPGGLVGPRAPTIPFQTSSFWAQGLNFGVEVNW